MDPQEMPILGPNWAKVIDRKAFFRSILAIRVPEPRVLMMAMASSMVQYERE